MGGKDASEKAFDAPEMEIEPSKLADFEARLDRLENYVALIAEPNAKKKDPNRPTFDRIADRLESSAFTRVLISAGAALAIFSFAGIVATAWGIRLQYEAMEDDKVARAWQSLATIGLGNAGRADAIRLIHENGEPLTGINIGGETRRKSAEIPNLKLDSAKIGDSDWRNVYFAAVDLKNIHFYRMYLDKSTLSGSMEAVEIAWTSAVGSRFGVHANSQLSIHASVFDESIFGIEVGRDLDGEAANSGGKESGSVPVDSAELLKRTLSAAGDIITFDNVSLRCALMPIEHAVNFRFESSNLSGAYIGDPYFFDEEGLPESAFARISSDEWQKFQGAWYFSDNPPVGVPDEYLRKYFVSYDRKKIISQCNKYEPRAREPDPFSLLDGVDGIESACVSLARKANACETVYPSSSLYMVGSWVQDSEEEQ